MELSVTRKLTRILGDWFGVYFFHVVHGEIRVSYSEPRYYSYHEHCHCPMVGESSTFHDISYIHTVTDLYDGLSVGIQCET